jgi:hypothetical protein
VQRSSKERAVNPRSFILVLCAVIFAYCASAPFSSAQVTPPAAPEDLSLLTPEQLEELVGPIALYPDPLIAQMLPASTYPIDVVRASRLVQSGATEQQIDQQDWDPSVKAVAHYPEVIEWMDTNIDWTQQLGQAFVAQPDDVMQAVQRLRARARDLGNLVDTPQQQILVEDNSLRIVPAQPDVIYVPVYEPSVVYYQQPPFAGGFVTFGFGFALGAWLDLDCDWNHHWCYRPGWAWNHWRDNIIVERAHVVRIHRDFDFREGERPRSVWHRDPGRPLVLPGHRLARPSDFDHFRGRQDPRNPRVIQPQPPHAQPDRGRTHTPAPGQPGGVFTPPPPGTNPRQPRDRGNGNARPVTPAPTAPSPPPRGNPPAKPAPAPTPKPAPNRPNPPTRTPPPSTTPIVGPMPAPGAPRPPAPRPQMGPAPARVAPPPVKIAPPPPAATAPARPPLTGGGPASQRGNDSRGHH